MMVRRFALSNANHRGKEMVCIVEPDEVDALLMWRTSRTSDNTQQ